MKENVIPVNWHWELLQRVSGWASYWGFLIVPHCKEENKSISQSSLNKSSEWGKWGCLYVWKRRNGWQEGGRRKEDSKEETINLQAEEEEDEEEEETIQSRWWTQKIMQIKHRTSKLLQQWWPPRHTKQMGAFSNKTYECWQQQAKPHL